MILYKQSEKLCYRMMFVALFVQAMQQLHLGHAWPTNAWPLINGYDLLLT